MSVHDGKPGQSWETGLSLSQGEDWDVPADTRLTREQDAVRRPFRFANVHGTPVPVARLRRIGWLDQKGRVWLEIPPGDRFDGGSLTPLLIDPGERDGS